MQFTKDEQNDNVDCSFLVFMGHGHSDGNGTYLKTNDAMFDVLGNCKHIFTMGHSRLMEKPKVMITQMCRSKNCFLILLHATLFNIVFPHKQEPYSF